MDRHNKNWRYWAIPLLTMAILAGVMLLPACTANSSESSGMITTYPTVGSFNRISVSGSVEVSVNIGQSQSVSITTEKDFLQSVQMKVSDDTLYIDTTRNFLPPDRPLIEITIPELYSVSNYGLLSDVSITGDNEDVLEINASGMGKTELEGAIVGLVVDKSSSGDILFHNMTIDEEILIRMSGEGDMELENVSAKRLDVRKVEGGDIKLKDIQVDGDIELKVGGWGNIEGSGTAGNLIIRKMFSYGDIVLSDLFVTKDVDVEMWDSGDVVVYPGEQLTGTNSSMSDLIYIDSPDLVVSVQNTGSGKVKKME